jgi:hypothetical protein
MARISYGGSHLSADCQQAFKRHPLPAAGPQDVYHAKGQNRFQVAELLSV